MGGLTGTNLALKAFMKSLQILTLLLSLWSASAWSIQCIELLSEVPNSVNGSVISSSKHYSWISKGKDSFGINGDLSRGILEFSIDTRNLETGQRIRFRGTDLFENMINHFGLENIDYIKGRWVSGDNYNEFTENLLTMNEKKAAKATWTGRRAAEYGFTRVKRVIYNPAFEGERKGSVRVYFTRPFYDFSSKLRFLKKAYNMEYWDE